MNKIKKLLTNNHGGTQCGVFSNFLLNAILQNSTKCSRLEKEVRLRYDRAPNVPA